MNYNFYKSFKINATGYTFVSAAGKYGGCLSQWQTTVKNTINYLLMINCNNQFKYSVLAIQTIALLIFTYVNNDSFIVLNWYQS